MDHFAAVRERDAIRRRVTPVLWWFLLLVAWAIVVFLVLKSAEIHLAIGVFIWLALALAPIVLFSIFLSPKIQEQFIEQRAADIEDVEKRLNPAATSDVPAVEFHGWSGTIQTFLFHNDDFAESFVQHNRGKTLN